MRRTLLVAATLLLVAVMVLPGCGGDKVVVVASPSGSEVRVGQQFTITLDSNRTAGYQWQLAKPLDEAVVTLVRSEYRAPDRPLPGAGGRSVVLRSSFNEAFSLVQRTLRGLRT